MAIPDYQAIMLPLLRLAGDGKEHRLRDAVETIAAESGLTEAERKETLSSGVLTFYNRVSWARTYLGKALLLTSTGRGTFEITSRGLDVLKRKPTKLSVSLLMQSPEFAAFTKSIKPPGGPEKGSEEQQRTPEEALELSHQTLRKTLAQELLERVKACSPRFFERLVVDLLVAMGYGGSRKDAGEAVGRSGDGGIDGIIKEDRLGLDAVYIQAKRWEGNVGGSTVQQFAGSLEGRKARKGVLITTSQFSKEAKEFVNKIEKRIVLIDGEQLAQFMIDYGIGVSEVANYTVKKLDLDYFGDGQ